MRKIRAGDPQAKPKFDPERQCFFCQKLLDKCHCRRGKKHRVLFEMCGVPLHSKKRAERKGRDYHPSHRECERERDHERDREHQDAKQKVKSDKKARQKAEKREEERARKTRSSARTIEDVDLNSKPTSAFGPTFVKHT
jgi:hypothetical protein